MSDGISEAGQCTRSRQLQRLDHGHSEIDSRVARATRQADSYLKTTTISSLETTDKARTHVGDINTSINNYYTHSSPFTRHQTGSEATQRAPERTIERDNISVELYVRACHLRDYATIDSNDYRSLYGFALEHEAIWNEKPEIFKVFAQQYQADQNASARGCAIHRHQLACDYEDRNRTPESACKNLLWLSKNETARKQFERRTELAQSRLSCSETPSLQDATQDEQTIPIVMDNAGSESARKPVDHLKIVNTVFTGITSTATLAKLLLATTAVREQHISRPAKPMPIDKRAVDRTQRSAENVLSPEKDDKYSGLAPETSASKSPHSYESEIMASLNATWERIEAEDSESLSKSPRTKPQSVDQENKGEKSPSAPERVDVPTGRVKGKQSGFTLQPLKTPVKRVRSASPSVKHNVSVKKRLVSWQTKFSTRVRVSGIPKPPLRASMTITWA